MSQGSQRKCWSNGARSSEEMTLQITSMADIFTILLVFLLKSFSTSSVNITPSPGMMIPEAKAMEAPMEALKLEITENGVVVESKPVIGLQGFKFPTGDVESNQSSKAVSAVLEIEHKRQLLIAEKNKSVKTDGKILIIADQRTPYSTVKTVLASAAINGFTEYKLVAISKE